MKTSIRFLQSLLLIILITVSFIKSGCAKNKPVTPDGSKPNEYSAYLFTAANLLYQDNQFERAEDIYRAALKFDPKSVEIKEGLFNAVFKRTLLNEVTPTYFAGLVDTLLSEKVMNKLMFEQAYDLFIRFEDNLRAKQLLDIYLKSYQTARAYSSLYYLEMNLYGKSREELLDKAFSLAGEDTAYLNSLGLLYLSIDSTKAESVWQHSRKYDTTTKATSFLWELYSVQGRIAKLVDLYQSFKLPAELEKLLEVLDNALNKGHFRSLRLISDWLLASNEPQILLRLLQASWMEEDDALFDKSFSSLQKFKLSKQDSQLMYFYAALVALRQNNTKNSLLYIAKLDGTSVLDELLLVHRAVTLDKASLNDVKALMDMKSRLTKIVKSSTQKDLSWQIINYLLEAIDKLTYDNKIEVSEETSYYAALWYFDNDRSTYDTFLNIALYYQKRNKTANLRNTLRQALDEYPEDAALLNWLGYSYILDGNNLSEAEVLVRRALQLSPDNPYYLDSLAWLYYQKGDFETALQLMDIPSQLEVIPSEISYHIACILLALKEYEEAKEYLLMSIEVNDNVEYVEKARQLLRQYP